jgi:hypothetical protein
METSRLTGSPTPAKAAAPGQDDRGATLFVWSAWAAMTAGALAFIYAYGCNIPFLDEWDLVGAVTGDQPVNLAWLWSQNNQHRIVLPRLIYVGLAWLTASDFRAGMYFGGLTLSCLAAVLMVAARRLRGRTSYADASFPLALLHAGHWENLLWSFQVAFVASTLLSGALLLLILRSRTPLTWGTGLASGLCLVALPLCGAQGLPLVPPLALWLVAWAWQGRRAPGRAPGWRFAVVAALTSAALVLMPLYFVGYQPITRHPPSPSWQATGKVSLEFLTVSFGHAIIPWWNYARFLVLGLLAGTTAALTAGWWGRRDERIRCLGLLLFLGAFVGLALFIGWGRAGIDRNAGFASRYTLLAVPWLVAVYFALEVLGPPARSRFVQMVLFLVLVALLQKNTQLGVAIAQDRRERFQAVERDLRAHLPADAIARRHPILFPLPDYLIPRLEWLRHAGIGTFKELGTPTAGGEGNQTTAPAPRLPSPSPTEKS